MQNRKIEDYTMACRTCGSVTTMTATHKCNGCWEVEHRLDQYLQDGGEKAKTVLLEAIRRYDESRGEGE